MTIEDQVKELLAAAISEAFLGKQGDAREIPLEHPTNESHGDFATAVAFKLAKVIGKPPLDIVKEIVDKMQKIKSPLIASVDAAPPGFINIKLEVQSLVEELYRLMQNQDSYATTEAFKDKRIMVEYAHPNTHKEMHIGHMRTLIVGEALVRIYESCGAKVFRANYQGDIGPHVAKAVYGLKILLEERKLALEKIAEWSHKDKAHLLGEAYVRGNQIYDDKKKEIDDLNAQLYDQRGELLRLYKTSRQWSLDYFEDIYKRFYTTFDRLFFESEVAECGKEIVQKNTGKVFRESEGAIIFPGDQYGLHKRVFLTQAGHPTYEGKEMCLGYQEYEAFPFDKSIHVVAHEQAAYFQVVFKALELIDRQKFAGRQHHLSMGMVQLVGRKMSSRTGELLTIDDLIDTVKAKVLELVSSEKIQAEDKSTLAEIVTIGAIKYSILRVGTNQDVAFDIEKSVSLEGDSGPYLQYTYARCRSVLRKSENREQRTENKIRNSQLGNLQFNDEEWSVLRWIYRFPEVVEDAAKQYAPNLICDFLFELAQRYNTFYHKHPILEPKLGDGPSADGWKMERRNFRLLLTRSTGQVIKNGLYLLGIEAPERM